ncbi:MAG TPA: methyltransferase domain-containing protein [Chloroflexota bacterium]|nr:methyltransferase domain-containing protein [Chloroflexota bacterium]
MTGARSESVSAHQRLIDAHFNAQPHFWQDLYAENSLYGTIHRERRAIALRWVADLALPPAARLLEVGCGAGLVAVELARRGYIVEAVDTSPAMVALARGHAAAAGVTDRLTVRIGDAHALPGETGSYTLVLALGVVPFLHSPAAALRDMARVLKPDGYVLLTSDNQWRLNHVLDPWLTPVLAPAKQLARRLSGQAGGGLPVQRYSYTALERLMSTVGLVIIRCTTLGFGPFSLCRRPLFPETVAIGVHRRLQRLANRGTPVLRATGAQYIVLARPAASHHASH